MLDVIDGVPNRLSAIKRGKALVAQGKPRREVAVEIYAEHFPGPTCQPSTYERRLRYLVGLLA